ncbi:MAG TPA: hypothetical protein VGW38_15470, partial [Chloroflexota bacterium]|nr:hypothetical protein [Chloroflexota bacterium]
GTRQQRQEPGTDTTLLTTSHRGLHLLLDLRGVDSVQHVKYGMWVSETRSCTAAQEARSMAEQQRDSDLRQLVLALEAMSGRRQALVQQLANRGCLLGEARAALQEELRRTEAEQQALLDALVGLAPPQRRFRRKAA